MPINEDNSTDYWGNRNPRCPFCDHETDVVMNDHFDLYEEGEHKINCGNCDREIKVNSVCTWTFNTDEQGS